MIKRMKPLKEAEAVKKRARYSLWQRANGLIPPKKERSPEGWAISK